jgi:hypothetical protein
VPDQSGPLTGITAAILYGVGFSKLQLMYSNYNSKLCKNLKQNNVISS